MAEIEDSNSNRIISGKSSLRSSIRPISATSGGLHDPSEALIPDGGKQRYLDVSNIFKNVFPDLTENSLGTVPNITSVRPGSPYGPANSDRDFRTV